MLTNRRKTHILDCLRRDGQAIAKTIASELGVPKTRSAGTCGTWRRKGW